MQSADPQTLCWSGQERKKASPGGIRRGPDSTPATRDVQSGGVLPGPEAILFVHRLSHPRSGAAGLALLVPASRGWAAIPVGKDPAAVRAPRLSLASLAYREEIHPVFLPSFEALPPSSPQPGQ